MLNPVVQGVHRISHSDERPTPGTQCFPIDSEDFEEQDCLTPLSGFVNVQSQTALSSFADSSLKCNAPKMCHLLGHQLQNRLR